MTETDLEKWLDSYGRAWENRDPEAAAALFSQDVSYFETPFGEPARGRDGVRDYWANATRNQADISFSYAIVSVTGRQGIARWSARITRVSTSITVTLDGIFLLEFEDGGLCRELREWWHSAESE
jgi:ketosteroid isomerase-like protein